MSFHLKISFILAIITTTFTTGLSAEDFSDFVSKAPYSRKERKRQEQQEQFLFNISKPIDSAFYLAFGGTVGGALSQKDTTTGYQQRVDQLDTEQDVIKQTSPYVGFMGIAGYRLNNILSTEFYYSESAWDFKRQETKLFTLDLLSESNKRIIERKQLDFGPRVIVALPISKYFSPYFMSGLMVEFFKETRKFSKNYYRPTTIKETGTTWKLMYAQGFGLRSQITKNFGMRLEIYVPYFIESAARANLITYVSF